MPIPISIFPSTYRQGTTSRRSSEQSSKKVEAEVDLSARRGRDGREERRETRVEVEEQRRPRRSHQTDVHIYADEKGRPSRREREVRFDERVDIDLERTRYVPYLFIFLHNPRLAA